jgi:hypothetical protein
MRRTNDSISPLAVPVAPVSHDLTCAQINELDVTLNSCKSYIRANHDVLWLQVTIDDINAIEVF